MTTAEQPNEQEYTPTTEQVREAFVVARHDIVPVRMEDRDSAFDRWLARVRREAKAEALREAADAYSNYEGGDNEHVVRLWLRMRAEESS